MVEYYKLSLLKRIEHGASWEEIYLEIDGEKSKIIATYPQILTNVLNEKLEKMTEEDVKKLSHDLSADFGH